MENIEGIPVVLQVLLPAVAEVTFEPDTDNYPIVGGASAELENKTILVSEIVYYSGAAGLSLLEYIEIDDQIITREPLGIAYDDTGSTRIAFKLNMKTMFGRDFIALRNKLAVKSSLNAGGDAVLYVYGIAVDRTQ